MSTDEDVQRRVLRTSNVQLSGTDGGPVVVFVHGFGCDQRMWRFVAPHFEHDHRVVLLDLVGFGESDTAAYDEQRYATLQAHADDVAGVLDALGLDSVCVVGHSVSAMIGALLSIARPDLVESLVMVAPSARYIDDEPYVGGFSAADIDELLDAVDRNFLGWSSAMAPAIMGNPDRPELGQELTASFCRTDPRVARHFAEVTFRGDHRADLPRVPVPTLVLQCSDDAIAPVAVGEFVHAAVSDSEFVLLSATGHCPNLSAPEETTAAIRRFLLRRAAARRVDAGATLTGGSRSTVVG